MSLTLLPSFDQNFSKFSILSLVTWLSAERMHHLFLNKLENPAAGPLYSVPAIGCEAIQLIFLKDLTQMIILAKVIHLLKKW